MSTSPRRSRTGSRWGRSALRVMLATLAMLIMLAGAAAAAQTPRPAPVDPFVRSVARVRPSVLAIGTYHRRDRPSARYLGSGFVIADGNLVATNAHVVDGVRNNERLKALTVFLPDQPPRSGRRAVLIEEDPQHDVALLRFAGPPLRPLDLTPAGPVRQGQAVGVVGYPIGMRLGVVPAAHKGVVAAVVAAVRPLPQGARMTPELARALKDPYDLYQLDLIVYPGNSGSPLFDASTGRVVGIINKTLATRTREHLLTHPSGISYAVPTRWLRALLARHRLETEARGARDDGKEQR
ncbi:MAG: serine protease [Phycisphaeraceae bacterium]|nr:serine protease [Phycisphaeraceae bacterium]